MDYILEVIEYIYKNIDTLPFPEHHLEEKFSVSRKKLYRDFKSHTGQTPYQYILKQKMQRVHELKNENPNIKWKEVMKALNIINYSIRSIQDNYSKYLQSTDINEEDPTFDSFDQFWKSKDQLNEILLRFVLAHVKYEVNNQSSSTLWLTYPVENTLLQSHPFGLDTAHNFSIWFNPDTDRISSSLILKSAVVDNGMDCSAPSHIDVYLSVFARLHDHLNGHENYTDITKSILHFDKWAATCSPFFMGNGVEEAPAKSIEIDRESEFIKVTNPFYEEIKDEMLKRYVADFSKNFSVDLLDIQKFNAAIQNDDKESMISQLSLLCKGPTNTALVDLLFSLMESPYLHNLDIESFPGNFLDQESLETTKSMTSQEMQTRLLSFKSAIDELVENLDDDELCSIDFKTLAKGIIK